MRKFGKFDAKLFAAVIIGALFVVGVIGWLRWNDPPQELGVTFSVVFAEELGLDWQETFVALLDDVGVRKFRIPVYWDRLEPLQGQFEWTELDWILEQAAAREGVELTLAIGRKVPRWPECFVPDWVDGQSEESQEQAVLNEIQAIVEYVGDNPVITRWQVENEPFLAFGEGCPEHSLELLLAEIDLVRSLDDRPIQLTASGEQEPWLDAAARGDILGVSMYRLVWSDITGFSFYPLSPEYYRVKAEAAKLLADEVIVSELQAEPWFYKPIKEFTLEEQYQSFDVEALQDNVKFSARTGLSESYLWGAEWWYYMKVNGDERHWEAVKEIFGESL